MYVRVARVLLAAALVAGVVACDLPAERPAAAQSGPRIVVVGDSVTEQAYGYAGGWIDAPGDVVKVSGSGWSLADAEGPYAQSVAEGPVDVTVLALGPNDALPASGGWDLTDIVRWHDFLADDIPAGSCVVVVLPRHKSGFPSNWAAELNEARDWILDLASPGGQFAPPTDVAVRMEDWKVRTAPEPTLLAPDGIHLSGEHAARVRQHQYWTGVNACDGGT